MNFLQQSTSRDIHRFFNSMGMDLFLTDSVQLYMDNAVTLLKARAAVTCLLLVMLLNVTHESIWILIDRECRIASLIPVWTAGINQDVPEKSMDGNPEGLAFAADSSNVFSASMDRDVLAVQPKLLHNAIHSILEALQKCNQRGF